MHDGDLPQRHGGKERIGEPVNRGNGESEKIDMYVSASQCLRGYLYLKIIK